MSRPVGERVIYFREISSREVGESRGEVDVLLRAERGKPPAGTTTPRGGTAGRWSRAGAGRRRGLLVVERRAVHVARLPIRLAAEAQDGGVVDEAVGDGDGLGGRREKLGPVLEREIRNDQRGALPIPGADHAKELVGGVAAEVREAGVVEEQQIGGGDAAEDLAVGAIGAGGVQALEHVGSGGVVDAEGVATGGMADGLGHGGLAGGGAADEDDVAVLVDEAAGEQFVDDLGGELRARGPVEALEGEGWAELAPAAPALELAFPAGALFSVEELVEELGVRGMRGLRLRQQVGEAAGGGGEVEPLQKRAHLSEGILRLGFTRHDRGLQWGAWSPACSRAGSQGPCRRGRRTPRGAGTAGPRRVRGRRGGGRAGGCAGRRVGGSCGRP